MKSAEYKSKALHDVAVERGRQINSCGYTSDCDDSYTYKELAAAGLSYTHNYIEGTEVLPTTWPWDYRSWKPNGDPRRDLVRAAALLVAEIERIDRAADTAESETLGKVAPATVHWYLVSWDSPSRVGSTEYWSQEPWKPGEIGAVTRVIEQANRGLMGCPVITNVFYMGVFPAPREDIK